MNATEQLIQFLNSKQWHIRCVESCTAGGLTAALGAITGVSSVLDRSWVTYSNQAKHEEVGVPLATLKTFGAVSEEVVISMVNGAVADCESNTLALSISGIAGPDGGTIDKPVGTIWIGLKMPQQKAVAKHFLFPGNRQSIQLQAIEAALAMPLQA